ncbi:MAG: NAD(P)(+) transhydrogenase (Re/Si-specific) subunit beta [Candidatus Latescibacteria bacterium]|nr:NAD(P)(+) transhydrogenase (Re/Si-specific) subunit beta [Candidatus Latescibacterota bacterium]
MGIVIDIGYIAASILFILGIKMLSKPGTARQGNLVSALGMFIAIVITLLSGGMSFTWIIVGLIVGSIIGTITANTVPMTAMPEMVALFNGFGGIASLLVGWAEYNARPESPLFTLIAIFFAVLIGGVAFSGSMIAYAKLAEKMPGKPILFKGQQIFNALLLIAIVVCGIMYAISPAGPSSYYVFIAIAVLSLILGIMAVIPIGGADMPVVISLLNSYSGLAACAAGFIILNNVLIVSGALVGASGIILTNIMCKAMNRSLGNVLFSGFGSSEGGGAGPVGVQGEAHPISAEDAYYVLEAAGSVVFVPGYGMAVAQAQHAVRELGEILENNGAEVRYAIHPVAGRMPGHMNVLLAEANVPYEQLAEMDDINPIINTIDVCIVIGANDVVNPAAREIESSPIYGMPIINVDYAKTVMVLKRSLRPGFAGVDNPLFFKENTRMLFGDAKATLQGLIAEFKES